jgi:excinuclease ABC subunit A
VLDSLPLDSVFSEEGAARFEEISSRIAALGVTAAELLVVPADENPFHSGQVDTAWPRLIMTAGWYCPVCGKTAPALDFREALNRLSAAENADSQPSDAVDIFLGELPLRRVPELPIRLLSESAAWPTELKHRLLLLSSLGLAHISLGRKLSELSSGERLLLACMFLEMAGLSDTLLIADEPSRVLGPVNLQQVHAWCRRMIDSGNTALVSEKNFPFLVQADCILELGPGAGERGGEIIFCGSPKIWAENQAENAGTFTQQNLPSHIEDVQPVVLPPMKTGEYDRIPLGCLVGILGPAGSGKSRLLAELAETKGLLRKSSRVSKTDFRSVRLLTPAISRRSKNRLLHKRVLEVAEVWPPLAELYASLPFARRSNFSAEDFLLHSARLRCAHCRGQGFVEEGEMRGEAALLCDICFGSGFAVEAQQIVFRECSLPDVLRMSVHEALSLFALQKQVVRILQVLEHFGLAALRLGTHLFELAASDIQRLTLASQFVGAEPKKALFLLDQPFAGLPDGEVQQMMLRLRSAAEKGNSFVFSAHSYPALNACDLLIVCGDNGGEKIILPRRSFALDKFFNLGQFTPSEVRPRT